MSYPNCSRCASYAINHQCHGRDGSGDTLCDVCYWRGKAELAEIQVKKLKKAGDNMYYLLSNCPETYEWNKIKESKP